jgi:hypothetical protein
MEDFVICPDAENALHLVERLASAASPGSIMVD